MGRKQEDPQGPRCSPTLSHKWLLSNGGMEPGKTAPTPSPLLTHVHNYVHICRTPNTISAAHTCKSPCTISPFCKRAKHHVQSVHTHHADAPSPAHTQNPMHNPYFSQACKIPHTIPTAHTRAEAHALPPLHTPSKIPHTTSLHRAEPSVYHPPPPCVLNGQRSAHTAACFQLSPKLLFA